MLQRLRRLVFSVLLQVLQVSSVRRIQAAQSHSLREEILVDKLGFLRQINPVNTMRGHTADVQIREVTLGLGFLRCRVQGFSQF